MSAADREKWDARWTARAGDLSAPEQFLVAQAPRLPRSGRALDVAGGSGRHALWLAEQGLEVTLLDVSPRALEVAASEARARDLELTTLELDSDAIDSGAAPFPPGPWDVILCHHFLWPPLFEHAAETLSEDGLLLFAQPTHTNLERHERPSKRFLLPPGELASWVSPHLDVLSLNEAWHDNGRHEAQLVATRKPD